jgi:PIN domain nuclease of toxin-antitoxin system
LAGGEPIVVLDTCALLWLVLEPTRLSARARETIRAHAESLGVSAISAFEIGQKHSRALLELPLHPGDWYASVLEEWAIAEVPITGTIALDATGLPPRHRDPFDRLIIATARAKRCSVLTPDPKIHAYAEEVLVEW